MAKKKVKKKVSKGKSVKKSVSRVDSEKKLRGKFYSFQKKVNRLEELKHELSSLQNAGYTKGFEKEVAIIRSRLKDTTAIPEVEKRIRALRAAIRKKKEPKRKHPIKKIARKVEEIDEEVEKTNKKLERRFNIIDENVVAVNKQLKNEIKNLQVKLDKSLEKKGQVSPEIGVVVDDEFQKFINDVKLDLSAKVKDKEHDLNDQLRRDLALRRKELKLQYRDMEKELEENYSGKEDKLKKGYVERNKRMSDLKKGLKSSYSKKESDLKSSYSKKESTLEKKYRNRQENINQKYQERVKNRLAREVHEKFSEELRKKFEEERAKLDYAYVSKMKKKYHDEFEGQKKSLDLRFKVKLAREMKKYKLDADEQKRQNQSVLRAKLNVLNKKRIVLKLKKKKLSDREKKQAKILEQKISQLQKERITDAKKLDRVKIVLKKELAREAHDDLIRKVAESRRKINEGLKREFDDKMQDFIVKQTQEKDREVQEKVKKFHEALLNQKKIDSVLRSNLSEAKYDLEQYKQKIKQFVQREKVKALVVAAEKRKFAERLELVRNKEEMKFKEEKLRLQKKVNDKARKQMLDELKKREELMRAKLEKDFEQKMKAHDMKQEEALDRKKAELADELKKKAAALLG
tara:strand:+ start:1264 stop:3156 length:1893 start_codon:yes stop_codon:yes gene_type:complete